MGRLELDKYYTPYVVAKHVVDKTVELVGVENIKEFIEPSAGSGVFLDVLDMYYKDIPYKAYDLKPEDLKHRVVEKDFFKVHLFGRKGRVAIGNPPFSSMAGHKDFSHRFLKRLTTMCEYIGMILPRGYFKRDMNKLRLLYTEDLGEVNFCGRDIRVCFNVYSVEQSYKKINYIDEDLFKVWAYERGDREIDEPCDYDFTFASWSNNLGVRDIRHGELANYYYIKITDLERKEEIERIFKETDWSYKYVGAGAGSIGINSLYREVKEQLGDISTTVPCVSSK